MTALALSFFLFSQRKKRAFQKIKKLTSSLNMTNFKEVCTVPTDFGVSFTKFKSEKTGLTVILADIEGKTIV